MKKIINYGILLFLVIILQFIWLQGLDNLLFVLSSIISRISYLLYTYDKFNLKNVYKILIYVVIFILFFLFVDVFATMIIFPIMVLINKILNHYKKLENNKQFFLWNIVLLGAFVGIAFLMKRILNESTNNYIIAMIFNGIAIITCIFEANKRINYNRFDVMDLIAVILSTIIILSLSIYNINGFNEVISENNIVLEKIQNRTINTEMDINNLVNDVVKTVGIQTIQEHENTEHNSEWIIFKGLKKTPVTVASMIQSLTSKDEYSLGSLNFAEKKQWLERNREKLTNLVITVNDYMCKPEITCIIISDFIYLLGVITLFYKRKSLLSKE